MKPHITTNAKWLRLLWLCLFALVPAAANAHGDAHAHQKSGATHEAAQSAVAAGTHVVDASTSCPNGGGACCCTRSCCSVPGQAKAPSPSLAFVLVPQVPLVVLQAPAYVAVASARLLAHLAGPRAPPSPR